MSKVQEHLFQGEEWFFGLLKSTQWCGQYWAHCDGWSKHLLLVIDLFAHCCHSKCQIFDSSATTLECDRSLLIVIWQFLHACIVKKPQCQNSHYQMAEKLLMQHITPFHSQRLHWDRSRVACAWMKRRDIYYSRHYKEILMKSKRNSARALLWIFSSKSQTFTIAYPSCCWWLLKQRANFGH